MTIFLQTERWGSCPFIVTLMYHFNVSMKEREAQWRQLPHQRARRRICSAGCRGPSRWVPRAPLLQTDWSGQQSRGTAQRGDPDNRTPRPASPPTGRSWSWSNGTMSGRMRRICGWKKSPMPWRRMCAVLSHFHTEPEGTRPRFKYDFSSATQEWILNKWIQTGGLTSLLLPRGLCGGFL